MAGLAPWDEAERAVLTCVLRQPDVLKVVTLRPEQFHRESHALIFRACRFLADHGQVVTPRSVALLLADYLKDEPEKVIQAAAYMRGLHAVPVEPDVDEARDMARKVREYAALRLGVSQWDSIGDLLKANDPRALAALRSLLASMEDGDADGDMQAWPQILNGVVAEIGALEDGTGATSVPTGLGLLDRFGVFMPGDLIILGARTSIGKSALALRLASWAAQAGRSVLYVSMEMRDTQLARRVLAGHAKVDSMHLRKGNLDVVEWECLYDTIARQQDWKFWVMDRGRRDIETIIARARRQKAHVGLSLLVVDYIQKVHTPDNRMERREHVGRICAELKDIAGELACPVLGLSQVRRLGGDVDDMRAPTLEDLKEAGSIEEDADSALLLYPDARGRKYTEWRDQETRPMTLEIAKARDGDTGTMKLNFVKKYVLFEDPTMPSPTWADRREAAV